MVHTGWRAQRQNLTSLSKMSYIFKIKIPVFQVITKIQKDRLPEFCYGFNKTFK
jgi:hypothetical protein